MADKKESREKKKARKKAAGLAALATVGTAAAIAPEAAQVIYQRTEAPLPPSQAAGVTVPEPARTEYTKPRPLRSIWDFLRGVFGAQTASANILIGQGGAPRAGERAMLVMPDRNTVYFGTFSHALDGGFVLTGPGGIRVSVDRNGNIYDSNGQIIVSARDSHWAVLHRDTSTPAPASPTPTGTPLTRQDDYATRRTPAPTSPITTPAPTPTGTPLTRQDDYATRRTSPTPTGQPLTRQDDFATRRTPTSTGQPLTRQDDFATRRTPTSTGQPLTRQDDFATRHTAPTGQPLAPEEEQGISPQISALNTQAERDSERARELLNDLRAQINNAQVDADARQASVDRALAQAGSFGINVSNNANLAAAVNTFNSAQADAAAYNAALAAWIEDGADPTNVPVFSPGFANEYVYGSDAAREAQEAIAQARIDSRDTTTEDNTGGGGGGGGQPPEMM